MKYFLVVILMATSSFTLFSQEIYGSWKITDYNIQVINESSSDDSHEKSDLSYSSFRAIIENDEILTFKNDNSLWAPCFKSFYNPRFQFSETQLKLIFGETEEKESFTRYNVKFLGDKMILSKETPSVVESYTLNKQLN